MDQLQGIRAFHMYWVFFGALLLWASDMGYRSLHRFSQELDPF